VTSSVDGGALPGFSKSRADIQIERLSMSFSILCSILLAALGGGSEQPSATELYLQNEEAEALLEVTGRSPDSVPNLEASMREALQDPPPPQPPPPPQDRPPAPPPPPPPPPPAEAKAPPSPFTFSINGRLPFPLGSVRFGTFSGGATAQGQRVPYDDLFESTGWGAGAEISYSMSDWDRRDVGTPHDKDADGNRGPSAVDRHSSGMYLSAQYDRFRGDSVAVGGSTLNLDRMSVESLFLGYKDHEPWGRGWFTEMRVGGGAIHYHPVNADITTGGTTSNVQLFKGTWGVAAEVAARVGVRLNEGLTIFAGGEGRAAEGPREGSGLPFAVSTNTFYTAAVEVGLEFGF
jgi:hypothetical protein